MADAELAALVGPGVAGHALPGAARLSLRCGPALREALGAAFGVALPETPLRAGEAGGRAALWLGPDEWLLLAEPGAAAPLAAALEAARGGAPASVVDVSDRTLGFALEGPGAPTLLNEGCPLDLDAAAFPPGACTRTLFGKAEIVLWRRGGAAPAFRIEVARSFAPYLWATLTEAVADLDPS